MAVAKIRTLEKKKLNWPNWLNCCLFLVQTTGRRTDGRRTDRRTEQDRKEWGGEQINTYVYIDKQDSKGRMNSEKGWTGETEKKGRADKQPDRQADRQRQTDMHGLLFSCFKHKCICNSTADPLLSHTRLYRTRRSKHTCCIQNICLDSCVKMITRLKTFQTRQNKTPTRIN